jgi:hypothetical protein
LFSGKNIQKVNIRTIKNNVAWTQGNYETKEIWVLDTVGSNLLDLLGHEGIDPTRTFSNDIKETYDILGVEAARESIYSELKEVIEFDGTYINYHHFSVLCDRMTFTSKMISIFRHGINNDNIGPIAKASFEETPEMFLKAARHAELDMMRGISANVMCGQFGNYGGGNYLVVTGWAQAPAAVVTGGAPIQAGVSNTAALGLVLYTKYFYLFQAAGMVLLTAMIGAIVLTLSHKPDVKRQVIEDQNARTRKGAIEIVKVPSRAGV